MIRHFIRCIVIIACSCLLIVSSAVGQRNVYLLYNYSGARISNQAPNSNLQGINSLPGVVFGATLPLWRHSDEALYIALSPMLQYRAIEGLNAYADLNQTSTTSIIQRQFRGMLPVNVGYKHVFSEKIALIGYAGFSIGVDISSKKQMSSCVQFLQHSNCFESNYDYEYGRDDIWFIEEFPLGTYPWFHRDISKYRRIDLGLDLGIEIVYEEWSLKLQNRAAVMPYATSSDAAILISGVSNNAWYHRDFMFGVARYF